MVIACITANVFAAALALSRLVFGLARTGYLPAKLSQVRERDRNPVVAALVVGAMSTLIAALGAAGPFSFQVLFSVTGGLFFVLYGIGVAAFARLAKGAKARVVAVVSALTIPVVTLVAGPPMWSAWAVFLVVLLVVAALGRRRFLDEKTLRFDVATLARRR